MAAPWFTTVIFDCDSTLSAIEGIDELAGGQRPAIEALTREAMQGTTSLETVFARRLALIRPTRAAVDALGQLYVDRLVPEARETVQALLGLGVTVQILSGGFAPAVRRVGDHLGITGDRVAAVDLLFDEAGRYADFDRASPMTRSHGKREWIAAHAAKLPPRRLMVGDGMTDLETRPVVDCFAAFTGVVRRESTVAGADVVLRGPGLEAVIALARDGPDP